MSKRVFWHKGMRLTDEVLRTADECTADLIGKALLLGAGGHFGLLPASGRPFNISLNISKNVVDVVSINCLGITRDGSLIDVDYDTTYTDAFDTRAVIPASAEDETFLLCIASTGEWRNEPNGRSGGTSGHITCEMVYSFSVIGENSPVPANALPIARLVYAEYSWRMDEATFVPPCLFVESHEMFQRLYSQFHQFLAAIDTMLPLQFTTPTNDARKIFWPIVQQLSITLDKERDFMTPMALMGLVQRLVSGFVLACRLDEYITLGDPEEFENYVKSPYNVKNAYAEIERGMKLCAAIHTKIEAFGVGTPPLPEVITPQPANVEAPTISKNQLEQAVDYGPAMIRVTNNTPGAIVYYTTDGSNPSQSSPSGETITVESGFRPDWHKEPPVQFTIKLMAVKGGRSSSVATYKVKVWKGKIPEI